jgi:hypothetical protein
MNLHEAQKQIRILTKAGNAVLMEGSSGLGKSAIAFSEFERDKADLASKGKTVGLGIVFAATQTPPDLIGYQFKGEHDFGDGKMLSVTEPSVPLWMLSIPHGDDPGGKPAYMYDKFWLIIEEYGQGEADVKRAMAEIFLNGGTAPWYLPAGSVRIGCTNVGSRYGVTKDFDFCIARRSRINITGDINILLPYLDKPYMKHGQVWQTMPVMKSWAATHPEIVFESEPKEQGPWCMPRTLCDADRYLQCVMAENNGTIPTDGGTIETLAGIIGMPATQSLIGHLQFRLELPSYADIVADPDNTPVPKKADLLLLMTYELAGYTQIPDLAACIKYIQRLPKDMAVTYVSSLLRRDYKNIINTPAMQGWINKNAALVSIIASLSQ